MDVIPKWADAVLVPIISLILAAVLSALVILAIGEDPVAAAKLMVEGAVGSTYGWGYTLYYATNLLLRCHHGWFSTKDRRKCRRR